MIPNHIMWKLEDSPEGARLMKFKTEVIPLMTKLADGKMLMEIMSSDTNPWMQEWVRNDYEPAAKACEEAPNATTLTIRDFVNIYYVAGHEVDDQNPRDVKDLYENYNIAVASASSDPSWKSLASAVAHFSLQAGLPSVVSDPLENLTHLRDRLLIPGSQAHEARLAAEVEQLRAQVRKQHRIITNLTFRHLLENLPGPRPLDPESGHPRISKLRHWKEFWDWAWGQAVERVTAARETGGNGTLADSAQHPLERLLRRFNEHAHEELWNVGADLYQRLSSNIHHFSGEFGVDPDQWDVLPAAILDALTPQTGRLVDGSVDWERERARYY